MAAVRISRLPKMDLKNLLTNLDSSLKPWQLQQMHNSTSYLFCPLRGGADKSLARPTSRCRRAESIVSLERGVCSCAELQVFSCYRGWKEACQATHAISTTSRRELSSSPPLPPQGKAPKEIHAILIETLGEHAPLYVTVKTRWSSLNVAIFPPVMLLILDDPKQWPPPRLLIKFTR